MGFIINTLSALKLCLCLQNCFGFNIDYIRFFLNFCNSVTNCSVCSLGHRESCPQQILHHHFVTFSILTTRSNSNSNEAFTLSVTGSNKSFSVRAGDQIWACPAMGQNVHTNMERLGTTDECEHNRVNLIHIKY